MCANRVRPSRYDGTKLPETASLEKIERGEELRRDGIVIRTWDLRKTYAMGGEEIHAVSGIDLELSLIHI